jgi:predicted metal-dependent phosphoesterase TrpH
MEISCSRYGRSIHLLGYLVDPVHPGLATEIGYAREARVGRLRRMVEKMAADGIPLTYEQVVAQVPPGATEGRPHIADALVANGTVPNRDEAFVRWLGNDSPYYVRHYAPDPVDAVRLVVEAGGVAVHAHPFGRGRGAGAGDSLVEEMAAAGLGGLEVYHRDHDEAARRHGLELADRLGLLVTGSSDYHGAGKENRLGENTTAPEVLAEIEARASGVVPVLR